MEVRDQGTYVPLREPPSSVRARAPEPLHQLLLLGGPAREVPLIHAVDAFSGFWDADFAVRQQEFADRRIQRETVNSAACRVDEHRRGPVHHVPCGDLLRTGLQAIHQRSVPASRNPFVEREDRSNRDVRVDVRAAVERIEQQDVVSYRELLGNLDQPLFLLGGHHAQVPTMIQRVEHHVMRVLIELLDFFSMYVALPRLSEDIDQARLAHLAVNQLRSLGQVVQDGSQRPCRSRVF